MPRPRPRFLQREVTRHGKVVWFVRRDHHGARIRIRAPYGSDDCWREYEAALAGRANRTTVLKPDTARIGSLAWLYAGYCDSGAWTELSPATRRQRENILKHVMASAGHEPADKI